MRLIDADGFVEDLKTEALNLYLDGMKGTPRPYKELYDIIDRINEQPTIEQPTWISCSERLPDCEWGAECSEPVFYKMKDTGTVYAGYYGTGGMWRDRYFRQYHNSTNGVDVDDVACWMYQSALPQPPKGDE